MDKKTYNELRFCNVCKLKQSEFQWGIICELTEQPADFIGQCKFFHFDREEYLKLRDEIIDEIKDYNAESKKNRGFWPLNYKLYESINTDYSNEEDNSNYVIEEKWHQRFLFIFIAIIILISDYFVYVETESKSLLPVIIAFFISAIMLIGLFLIWLERIKKIIIDFSGVRIYGNRKTEKYNWSEILAINVLTEYATTKGGGGWIESYTLIISFISGMELKYASHPLTKKEKLYFLYYVEKFRKAYWDTFLENVE